MHDKSITSPRKLMGMNIGYELCKLQSTAVSSTNSRPSFLTSGGFIKINATATLRGVITPKVQVFLVLFDDQFSADRTLC